MMIAQSLLLTIAALAAPGDAPRVAVTMLDGTRVEGVIARWASDELVVRTDLDEQTLQPSDLLGVRFIASAVPDASPRPIQLELIDGSMLTATKFRSMKPGEFTVTLDAEPLKIAARQVAAVRFYGEGKRLDVQWEEIRSLRADGDLLVVRKGDVLDYVEGRVLAVDEQVKFELDGDAIDVRRSKIAGIVFLRPDRSGLAEPVGIVHTLHGSSVNAQTIHASDGRLFVKTTSGLKINFAIGALREVNLAAGKVRYLSNLEPIVARFEPFVPLGERSASVLPFFAPRRDLGREGGPIRLGGRPYAKGLALRSRTELQYRLPHGFSRFKTLVGIDDHVGGRGSVVLTIRAGDDELFTGRIVGGEKPKRLDLPVSGVKRLTIFVDYGEDTDFGDYLNLADARITK